MIGLVHQRSDQLICEGQLGSGVKFRVPHTATGFKQWWKKVFGHANALVAYCIKSCVQAKVSSNNGLLLKHFFQNFSY